ncbi:MAG TPA: hypothetical protein VIV15_08815 [Anaerolineales bacterium]
MPTEGKQIILRVVERYLRTGVIEDEQVKVMCLPAGKTSFVEHTGEDSRTILLDEYRMDGSVTWANYSARSGTVYLSVRSTPQKTN